MKDQPGTLRKTPRTRLRREPTRAVDSLQALYDIVDECYVCHVGFIDEGKPVVIPTLGWRVDNTLYIHGSRGSRMLKVFTAGGEASVTFTLLDGLVMAKSPFNHSANYRSAVIFGHPVPLDDNQAKLDAMQVFMQNIAPGRWQDLRKTSQQEIEATDVLGMPIDEASVKIRSGGPIDDEADADFPVWTGVLPIRQVIGPVLPDSKSLSGVETPDYSAAFGSRWFEQ